MIAPTKRNLEVLAAIKDLFHELGYMPSIKEIGAMVGLSSTASVWRNMKVLQDAGLLRRERKNTRNKMRALFVQEEPEEPKTIPFLGNVR